VADVLRFHIVALPEMKRDFQFREKAYVHHYVIGRKLRQLG
jgi:hypothetical protein